MRKGRLQVWEYIIALLTEESEVALASRYNQSSQLHCRWSDFAPNRKMDDFLAVYHAGQFWRGEILGLLYYMLRSSFEGVSIYCGQLLLPCPLQTTIMGMSLTD